METQNCIFENDVNELDVDNSKIVEQPSESDETSNFDAGRAKKNVLVSVIFKIVLLLLSLLTRRFLIKYVGNDANGLNSLYTSVIGFLGIAELGIGTAIVYCMYEPIIKGDVSKVRQLYTLFKKVYVVIGLIVLVAGLILLFFMPYLSKGYNDNKTIYITYLLSLGAVIVTYFYSAKMSLINAYKNNYITTLFTSIGLVIQYVLQIVVLVITKSFISYCVCKIVASLIQLLLFSLYNKNKDITSVPEKIDKQLSNKVVKNVKAMFLHKIGDVIFGNVDSIVISSIIGVVILGYYSNYLTFLIAMNEVLKLFIVPLTAVIGHMGIKANNEEKKSFFIFFYSLNFILGIVFYLGYYAVCNDAINIFFGEGLLLEKDFIIILVITYFIQFMRQSASVFKDSFGLFYKDRFLALLSALANAGLSVWFAYEFGIYGVLIATIVVDLLMYHIVEPFVLFKYGFEEKPIKYYIMNYCLILFFVAELYLFSRINIEIDNSFLHLVVCGALSVGFNIIPVAIVCLRRSFRNKIKLFIKRG